MCVFSVTIITIYLFIIIYYILTLNCSFRLVHWLKKKCRAKEIVKVKLGLANASRVIQSTNPKLADLGKNLSKMCVCNRRVLYFTWTKKVPLLMHSLYFHFAWSNEWNERLLNVTWANIYNLYKRTTFYKKKISDDSMTNFTALESIIP